MSQWTRPPTILQLSQDVPKTLLRLKRLELLHRLVRAKRLLELQGVDTSRMLSAEQAAALRALIGESS